ncbi:MAG: hypothetical protein NT157_02190 [Candidatus Micrarchaeota archaeon]|nr:hypothetical protein [Candidatus Micrarchaeota archaeon]
MRGFFANLVAFGCLFLLLLLAAAYPKFSSRHSEAALASLAVQKNYYCSLDFKHAMMQILSSSKSAGDREEIIAKIAERSAEFEQFIERADGEVDIWCGIVTEAELRALPSRMMQESKPLKCKNCWDFSKKTFVVDAHGKPRQTYVCSSFFDFDPVANKAGISKGGLALNPSPEVLPKIYSGKFAIGISIFDSKTNSSYVGILEDGTWAG